jgi:hypothetical protein
MNIKENEIIVLENSQRYVILNSIEHDGTLYFLAMGITEMNDVIPNDVIFLKTVIENRYLYAIKIKDQKLISELTTKIKR